MATKKPNEARAGLEALTADVGQMLGGALKELAPGLGFCLLMFDYGGGGNLAYVSTAKREDMVKLLDEFREMLVSEVDPPS